MSKIEWTGKTWNPVTGCTKISAGCKHCYAETMAKRLQAMGAKGYENGFELTVQGQDAFDKPLRCKKPTTYFVCSMSDLFHESVSFSTIDRVIEIIEQCPQHTFQILTKRAARMSEYFNTPFLMLGRFGKKKTAPKNVWLGVTCENQETANERIPHLLSIDASVRFLSIEPMLGEIDIFSKVTGDLLIESPLKYNGGSHIDWIIVGGESGHKARPMNPEWARSIRDQCAKAHHPVDFFFKQWGEWKQNIGVPSLNKMTFDNGVQMMKVGKKQAGRLLDGVLHDAMPKVGL